MAYTINKSNGQVLITLQDGTVDTSRSSLTLVGKNYPGFGEILNENLVHILENFAAPTQPRNPLIGQIWYNTSTNKLNVFNGVGFKDTVSTSYSNSAPTRNATGDFWFNPVTSQLSVYNGTTFTLIGPTISQNNIFASDVTASGTVTADDVTVNDDLLVGDTITSESFVSSIMAGTRVLFTETVSGGAKFVTDADFTYDEASDTLTAPNISGILGTFGTIALAAGTNTLPSITRQTNTNTGIFFPGTNQIAISTGGAETLRVNTGNLGVGIATPAEKLHLVGNFAIGNAPGLTRSGRMLASNALPSSMSLRQEFGTDGTGWRYSIASSNAGVVTDHVHVVDNGNVGFGTSSPTETITLFSAAESKLGLKTQNHSYVVRVLETDGSLRVTRTTSGTNDAVTVTNTGNVGVGTTVPAYKVDVAGDVNVTGNYYVNGVPFSAGVGEVNTASNLGVGGFELFSSKVGVDLQFKRLYAGPGITIISSATGLNISSSGGGGGGEANTASNRTVAGAAGVFAGKVGVDLQFRRIAAGAGIAVTEYSDYITIAASGGGGGGSNIDVFDDVATNAERYLTFSNQTASTMTQIYVSSGKLTYNPNTGVVRSVDFVSTSDARLKTVLGVIPDALHTLTQIQGVRYVWNQLAANLGIENDQEQLGVLAQEVEEVLPQAVSTANGYKAVNYDKLVPVLIEAIKQLNTQVQDLQTQLSKLG